MAMAPLYSHKMDILLARTENGFTWAWSVSISQSLYPLHRILLGDGKPPPSEIYLCTERLASHFIQNLKQRLSNGLKDKICIVSICRRMGNSLTVGIQIRATILQSRDREGADKNFRLLTRAALIQIGKDTFHFWISKNNMFTHPNSNNIRR